MKCNGKPSTGSPFSVNIGGAATNNNYIINQGFNPPTNPVGPGTQAGRTCTGTGKGLISGKAIVNGDNLFRVINPDDLEVTAAIEGPGNPEIFVDRWDGMHYKVTMPGDYGRVGRILQFCVKNRNEI